MDYMAHGLATALSVTTGHAVGAQDSHHRVYPLSSWCAYCHHWDLGGSQSRNITYLHSKLDLPSPPRLKEHSTLWSPEPQDQLCR